VAHRATTVKPSDKSVINALSLKERVEKHPIHYFAYTVIAVAIAVAFGVAWLSEHYQVSPRDGEIAYLKEQLSEREKTISKLEAAREPDLVQINQLLATNQKLENDLRVAHADLKQSREVIEGWKSQDAALQKKLETYATNSSIMSEIRELDKRKSDIEKKIASRWLVANEERPLKKQNQRQLDELQARILVLQQRLACEAK
jgi:chromosome segregation ATPase